jgi:hypothetical protein
MIGAVADGYLDATPEELKDYMEAHDSKYAIFDRQIILDDSGLLGGKYGALNYLSCAYNNETNVSYGLGESQCESDHTWETVFVSSTPCTISSLTEEQGVTAYKVYENGLYKPYYQPSCVAPTNQTVASFCRRLIEVKPAYCVGTAMLANGQKTAAAYYLNQTYPNGDLKLNKGIFQSPYSLPTTLHMGPVTGATLFYTNDTIWLENGELKSGYEDRKGKFYDSTLYQAFFLESLPGFDLVYTSPDSAVKIYKISE